MADFSLMTRMTAIANDVEVDLEAAIERLGKDAPPSLCNAMRHGALAGGKRLRPFLVRESARLFNADQSDARVVATALECVHCYSLIHDDLPAMDDDDLRRGKPTVHIAYDDATAILAGDALLTLAFDVMTHSGKMPDSVRIRLIAALSMASGACGMVGGQVLDLAAEKAPVSTVEGVKAIQAKKTGALIRFGAMAGGFLADASPAEVTALTIYGDRLGLAFQIKDDLLDVESSAEEMGKAVAKDAEAGKATFVSLYGVEGARTHLKAIVEEAEAALAPFGPKASTLSALAQFVATRKS